MPALLMTPAQRGVSRAIAAANSAGVPPRTSRPRSFIFLRTSGRRHQAEPWHGLEPRIARFGHRRQLGRDRRAAGGSHSESAQLAFAHERHDVHHVGERQADAAGEEIGEQRGRAAVRDRPDVDAGHGFEELRGEVLRGSRAGVRIGEHPGLRARQRDQLRQRLRRHAARHDQHVGGDEDLRDRRQVLDRIEAELLVQARAEHQRAVADHAERVPVRRRLGEAIGGNVSAGPGYVLDHDRPAPGGAELLREQATRYIRCDAGGEADQDAHRLLRIVALRGRVRGGRSNRQPRN